ncbi:transcription cofactor vestigial-like protein 4b isoform X2 [Lates japonicus]|uniref:Transcription cofactor vestigial-like protein 4b isoform X2 n=1 Tax=Lates japonicus TaxID=270547 RepID=A0AAD3RBA4_LATJO|nr:transcription cofactor vestigial-like protein 4b isoform X2 [Lates japonicus]
MRERHPSMETPLDVLSRAASFVHANEEETLDTRALATEQGEARACPHNSSSNSEGLSGACQGQCCSS